MKRCPECRKDYLDDSLLYCLDDGAALVQGTVTNEPATVILSGDAISGEGLARQLPADKTGRLSTSISNVLTRVRLPWIVAAIFAGLAAVLGYAWLGRASSTAQVVWLTFTPPAELAFNDRHPDAAVISPDGQQIAFTATSADGKQMLYVRNLNSSGVKLLPGSENALEPFWSPDSRFGCIRIERQAQAL
ncbi:MAG: hypothetical protein ABL984_10010 [Pyrinomonadaceae bacterium]